MMSADRRSEDGSRRTADRDWRPLIEGQAHDAREIAGFRGKEPVKRPVKTVCRSGWRNQAGRFEPVWGKPYCPAKADPVHRSGRLTGDRSGACSATRQSERMRSEGGPTGRQSESKNGGSVGTGPVLDFSLATVPKARPMAESNEPNFEDGQRLPE